MPSPSALVSGTTSPVGGQPHIDDHLPRERFHPFGFEIGQLSMLAWQTYRNAQTDAVFAPSHVVNADTGPPLQHTG